MDFLSRELSIEEASEEATPLPPIALASTEARGLPRLPSQGMGGGWGVGADSPGLTHPEPQRCSLRPSSAARRHGVTRKNQLRLFSPGLSGQPWGPNNCISGTVVPGTGEGGAQCRNTPLQGQSVLWRGSPCQAAFTDACSVPSPIQDTRAIDVTSGSTSLPLRCSLPGGGDCRPKGADFTRQ